MSKKRKTEIIEFETDDYGRVIIQDDLIQIKIWKYINEVSILVGSITFHYLEDDFNFSGIVNERNSKMIIDLWFHTGISDYIIHKVGNELVLKFYRKRYIDCIELIKNYKQFIRDNPEYQKLKLIKNN